MDRAVIVYGLSADDGELRYIGQSIQAPRMRHRQHMHYARRGKNTPVYKWMLSKMKLGEVITITVLVENAVWHETEKETIAHYRSLGARLLNITDGGEGTLGYRHSGRKRPDLAARNKSNTGKPGRPRMPGETEKLMTYIRGSKRPWVSERNRSMKGKPGHKHTDEHKARVASPEWQAKCRAGEVAAKARRGMDAVHS